MFCGLRDISCITSGHLCTCVGLFFFCQLSISCSPSSRPIAPVRTTFWFFCACETIAVSWSGWFVAPPTHTRTQHTHTHCDVTKSHWSFNTFKIKPTILVDLTQRHIDAIGTRSQTWVHPNQHPAVTAGRSTNGGFSRRTNSKLPRNVRWA